MSKPTLPLPPNFFACPRLTDEEIKYFKLLASSTATEVVQHAHIRDGGIAWTLRADEGSLRFYKAPDPLKRPGAHMYMSVIEVAGTLDEVIDLFRTNTTQKAKEYVKRFGKGLLDAVNLYSIIEPTPEYPNEKVGMTWFAMKTPFDRIVANRDCVMLECQHEFTWFSGQRAWVRALRSVDLECCPDLFSTLGLVRSTQYGVGHICVESQERPGYIEISFLNHFDVKGNPPEWLIEMGMKKRCKSVLEIELFLRENRLSIGYLMSPAEFVPLNRRRHCFLCRKKFSPWSKRSNCWKCGEVLCRSCNATWNVKLHGAPSKIKACIRCAQTPPDLLAAALGSHRNIGMSNSSGGLLPNQYYQPPLVLATTGNHSAPERSPISSSIMQYQQYAMNHTRAWSAGQGSSISRRFPMSPSSECSQTASGCDSSIWITGSQVPFQTRELPRASSLNDLEMSQYMSKRPEQCDSIWTTTLSRSASQDNSSSTSEEFQAITNQWTTNPHVFREQRAAVRMQIGSPRGPIYLE